MKSKYPELVYAIQPGDEADIERVVRTNNATFFRTKCGKILSLSRHYANLRIGCGHSDADRSAFAKLAGIPVKDYIAFLREEAKKRSADEKKREHERFKRRAERLGYRLVKINKKPVQKAKITEGSS